MATTPSRPPPIILYEHSIALTCKERVIFDRLLQVLRHFSLKTKLRVAGGWVRDKLLGINPDDIDIALDDMLGSQFCEKITEYLSSIGEETTDAAVIRSKHQKSKHLEAAKMRLYDIWIDFVNLRAEDYCESSRVPNIRFGSAEEDAYRRDLTINSLFYNITNDTVEDFTGRGLELLKHGNIVTPLPPKETFLDDPLRVLRAIRFGVRFGFILDKDLETAAKCVEVKAAMAEKISRERIHHEVDLMISGNDPVKAMTYMCDLSLFSVVFTVPPEFELSSLEEFDRHCINNMDAVANLLKLIDSYAFTDGEQRLTFYAALLLPLRKFTYKNEKSKQIFLVDCIFRESLKLKGKDRKALKVICSAAEKFASLIPCFISSKDVDKFEADWEKALIDISLTSKLRVYAGLLLDETKELWRISLLISTLLYPNVLENSNFDLQEKKEIFTTVENNILKLGLDEVALGNLKPLVDGKVIMSALELKSGSSLVQEWIRKVRQWQLAHPFGTKEECVDWIKETHSKRVKRE